VKITRLKAQGFRSLLSPQKIELKMGRSMCLVADNGRGKTSVVDALEFWSTGDVAWVHRDGVGLGALVHLSAPEAVVEVTTDSVSASRRLAGSRVGELTVGKGLMLAGSAPEPIPMLRHRTMADFVDKTANDKRTELLTMLGLSELVPFRLGLRSAARRTRSAAAAAMQTVQTSRGALEQALGGLGLEAKIAELSSTAGVSVASQDDLLAFAIEQAGTVAPTATRLAQVDELQAANQAAAASSVARWNTALADQRVAGEQGLSALLAAGQQLLAGWDDDRCPLCLAEQPRDELAEHVRERALELAEADQRFAASASEAEEREQVILRLGRALRAIVEDERNAGWQYLAAAQSILGALRAEVQAVKDARAVRGALALSVPTLDVEVIAALRAEATRAPGESGPALLELARLRGHVVARERAAAELRGAERVAAATERAATLGEAAVRSAIDEALAGLNLTVGDFYTRLIGGSPYDDVRLEYRDARAGGVEFSFVWNGSEEVSPPHRVMSESQLGALGLALFLARLKLRPPQWRTMVLDDVVTSFDIVHRTRLVRLLEQDFGEWQVILCTHDQQLARVIDDETSGWRTLKVATWTPDGGTVFGEAEPRKRLGQLLQEGRAADELGGLARQCMEQALERPVRRLRLPIPHDPNNVYSAADYRRALLDGLRDGGYVHADHAVLKQLATNGSMTNRACHFKEHEPGITAQDLELLLTDLDVLDSLFYCDGCQKKAWDIRAAGSPHCQCECGKLSCA
jgi:hypothetical protein